MRQKSARSRGTLGPSTQYLSTLTVVLSRAVARTAISASTILTLSTSLWSENADFALVRPGFHAGVSMANTWWGSLLSTTKNNLMRQGAGGWRLQKRGMRVRGRQREAPGARQRQALRRGARFRASTRTSQTCTRDCVVDALSCGMALSMMAFFVMDNVLSGIMVVSW